MIFFFFIYVTSFSWIRSLIDLKLLSILIISRRFLISCIHFESFQNLFSLFWNLSKILSKKNSDQNNFLHLRLQRSSIHLPLTNDKIDLIRSVHNTKHSNGISSYINHHESYSLTYEHGCNPAPANIYIYIHTRRDRSYNTFALTPSYYKVSVRVGGSGKRPH